MHVSAIPLSLLCLFAVFFSGTALLLVPGTVIWDTLWSRLARKHRYGDLSSFETFALRIATGILFQTFLLVLTSVSGVFDRRIPLLSAIPFLGVALYRRRGRRTPGGLASPQDSSRRLFSSRSLLLVLVLSLPPLIFYQLNLPVNGMDDMVPAITAQRLILNGNYAPRYAVAQHGFLTLITLPACVFPFVPVKNLMSGYTVFLGIFLLLSMYKLAEHFFGKRTALFAALCLLVFPLYDRIIEIRPSTFSYCFMLISLCFFSRAVLEHKAFFFYLSGFMLLVSLTMIPAGAVYGLMIYGVFFIMRGIRNKRPVLLVCLALLAGASAASLRILCRTSGETLPKMAGNFFSYYGGNYSLLALLGLGGFLLWALGKKETRLLPAACLAVIFLHPVLCLLHKLSGLEILSEQHIGDVFKSNKEWFMAIPLSLWAGQAIAALPCGGRYSRDLSPRKRKRAALLSYSLVALLLVLPHQATVYRSVARHHSLILKAITGRLGGERGIVLSSFLPGSFTSSQNPLTAPLTMKWGYLIYRGSHPVTYPRETRFMLTVYKQDITDLLGALFYSSGPDTGSFVYPRIVSGTPQREGELDPPYYENFVDLAVLSQFTGLLPAKLTSEEIDVLYGGNVRARRKVIDSKNISWIVVGPGEAEKFPGAPANLATDPSLSCELWTSTYSAFRVEVRAPVP